MIRHGSDRVEKLPINLSGAFLFCCMIVAYYEIIAYGSVIIVRRILSMRDKK